MERTRKRNHLYMAVMMVGLSFTQAGCNAAEVLKAIATGLNALSSVVGSSSTTGTAASTTASTGTAAAAPASNLSSLVSGLTANPAQTSSTPVSNSGSSLLNTNATASQGTLTQAILPRTDTSTASSNSSPALLPAIR